MQRHHDTPDETMRNAAPARPPWLVTLRRYLLFALAAHLTWESAHVPLYTIWAEGEWREIAFAVIHCTGGDLLIAFATLGLALVLAGDPGWPSHRFAPVAALAVGFGLAYTVFSEWLNIVVRKSWAYSELMPVIPIIDTGLSPFAQWIVIPLAGLTWARRASPPRSAP